jgi:hypothetical protein
MKDMKSRKRVVTLIIMPTVVPLHSFMRFMVKRWCISETGALQLGFGAADDANRSNIQGDRQQPSLRGGCCMENTRRLATPIL